MPIQPNFPVVRFSRAENHNLLPIWRNGKLINWVVSAEVEDNLKFRLHIDFWSCFRALFTTNLIKPPLGSSQVPPNLDPTSTLEL